MIATIVRQWFTAGDNQSFELGRALWALGVLAMIAYQGIALWWRGEHFNPVEFGTGFGAILAAGGFGVAAKDKACNGNGGS
jgi:high-affinity Fe2+/Pb2+ permease